MKNKHSPILVGSTFPLSLIRRRVSISPRPIQELRDEIQRRSFLSFWGHQNTIKTASNLLGVNIKPLTDRPAIHLDGDNLPTLDGQQFTECWVLSPDYVAGYRPNIGEEVNGDKILGWQVLRISWV